MKLIRYLLSHFILIVVLVLLVMAFIYRAQLFPENVVARIDGVAAQVMFWKKPKDTQQSVAQYTEEQTPATSTESKNTTDLMPTPQQSASGTQSETVMVPQASVGKETPAQDVQPKIASSDQAGAAQSNDTLLDEARTRYSQGDISGAIALYQQLAQVDPDNPNAYGELGNIYYTQGSWKLAGEAYYEAATHLLARGDKSQVLYLYRVIEGLDPVSADKLKQKLGDVQ